MAQKTFFVTVTLEVERVYTVKAKSADDAKTAALGGRAASYEDAEGVETVQGVEKDTE